MQITFELADVHECSFMQAVSMHDSAAHPSSSSGLSKVSQLGEFFKHSLDDWTRALRRKGFISLQVRTFRRTLLARATLLMPLEAD